MAGSEIKREDLHHHMSRHPSSNGIQEAKQPSHPDCLLVSHITHDIPMIKSANHGMMCDPKISKLIQVHPKSSKMTCHGLKWLRIQRKIAGSGGHCLRQAHGSRPSSTSFSPWRGSAMKKEGRAAQ